MTKELEKIVIDRIKDSSQRRISFAEYMNLALYHREYGYYNSGAVAIGKEGDFYTSSSFHDVFFFNSFLTTKEDTPAYGDFE